MRGGPRRKAAGRVRRVTGEPVPGLYAGGELGSVYGMLYPSGGGNIAECLAFGRIAGRNVVSGRGARRAQTRKPVWENRVMQELSTAAAGLPEKLRAELLDGTLQPGSPLREMALAER